jgi:hypothetical protein
MYFGESPGKADLIPESEHYSEVISDDLKAPEKKPALIEKEEKISEKTPEHIPGICIIMDDLGYGYEKKFDIFTRLKGLDITMSVIPGTYNAVAAEQLAHDHGFEVMAHLPMQAKGFENKYEHETHEQLFHSLDRMIHGFSHIAGANNHMGSLATTDKKTMLSVLTYLKNRDLFFVDSLTTSDSVVEEVCEVLNMRYMARDVFIDNLQDEKYIRKQIDKLFTIADNRGYSVGICHVRKNTVNVLENYLRERTESGEYRLIFASELMKDPKKYSLSKAGNISSENNRNM